LRPVATPRVVNHVNLFLCYLIFSKAWCCWSQRKKRFGEEINCPGTDNSRRRSSAQGTHLHMLIVDRF
jgi:hypothetical protein